MDEHLANESYSGLPVGSNILILGQTERSIGCPSHPIILVGGGGGGGFVGGFVGGVGAVGLRVGFVMDPGLVSGLGGGSSAA